MQDGCLIDMYKIHWTFGGAIALRKQKRWYTQHVWINYRDTLENRQMYLNQPKYWIPGKKQNSTVQVAAVDNKTGNTLN